MKTLLCSLAVLTTAHLAHAQFSSGANPITGTVGAQTLSSGTGTVAAGGAISTTGSKAVTLSGTGTTLDNFGSILVTSGSGRGIDANGTSLTITNNAGAILRTQSSDAVRAGNSIVASSITLTNAGLIEVLAGGQAIDWASVTGENILSNSGGIRANGEDAVRPGANGQIINSGTIQAIPVGGSGSDGIQANASGVMVMNTGTISGRHAITSGVVGGSIAVVNLAPGVITGVSGSGLNIDEFNATVSVTNFGRISGTSTTGDADGIDVDGTLTLNNYGVVQSLNTGGTENSEGITIGAGTIHNFAGAEISGQTSSATAVGRGITVDNSSGTDAIGALTLTNEGLIRGYTGAGVRIAGSFADTITNSATGTIRGGGTEATISTSGGNDTLVNRGVIRADGTGAAVDLGAGDDLLRVQGGGATIVGNINGGSGTDTLEVAAGTGGTFLFSGALLDFATATVEDGTFRLAGAQIGADTVSVRAGATLAGRGALDGDLNLVDGSRLAFTLGATESASDLLTVAGQLSLAGSGSVFVDLSDNGLGIGDYTLLSFGGSNGLSLADFLLGSASNAFGYTFNLDANALSVSVTAIPEPATSALLLAVGVLLALGVRRRWVRR